MQPEAAIRTLVDQIDAYLSRLEGSGIEAVRSLIATCGDKEVCQRTPRTMPNAIDYATALKHLADSGEQALASAIVHAAPHLPWTTYDAYGRDAIGEAFADGHVMATLIGAAGVIEAPGVDVGLFLVGPHVLYRDHRHAAPELYAPLTGPHGWRFAPGDSIVWKGAHEPVWNDAFQSHAILTGDAPFLAIYGWTRDADQPAQILAADDWAAVEKLRPPADFA